MSMNQDVNLLLNNYLELFKQLKSKQKLSHAEHKYLFMLAHVFYAYAEGYQKIVTDKVINLPSHPKQALGVLLAEPQVKRHFSRVAEFPQLIDFFANIRQHFMENATV